MEGREKVATVNCSSYKQSEVDKAINQALNLINFKFRKGMKVLIKPNVLSPKKPEEGVTTHPAVIEAICKILRKHESKIFIGESSSYETARGLRVSGIASIAANYGTLVNFDVSEKIKIKDNSAAVFKEFYLPRILKEVDLIINVPKLKTHELTKVTLAVKNLFGCIPGYKMKYHKIFPTEEEFSELLLDIYQNIKPGLNILDGIVSMEGAGPAAGKLKKTSIVMASRNAVALDYVASEIIGYKPEEIFTNLKAEQRNLKNFDIEAVGIKPIIEFEKPKLLVRGVPGTLYAALARLFPEKKPALNKKKCTKCGLCAKYCPAKAVFMNHPDSYPCFERKKCIRCFCCSEICPEHAIMQNESIVTKEFNTAIRIYRKATKKIR